MMAHSTQEHSPPGRDDFWTANAVVLLTERDARIARLRARIRQLEKSRQSLRGEVRRLQRLVESLAARCAGQSEALEQRAIRQVEDAQDDDSYDDESEEC